jgi:hypothetical protein
MMRASVRAAKEKSMKDNMLKLREERLFSEAKLAIE